mmetsp:Transcript_4997/g.18220  ORF Transcript_4997/g.18220 Transcript_4997/m.18220 type:complete len:253 (-) Transcript_4997:1554-2312(-)
MTAPTSAAARACASGWLAISQLHHSSAVAVVSWPAWKMVMHSSKTACSLSTAPSCSSRNARNPDSRSAPSGRGGASSCCCRKPNRLRRLRRFLALPGSGSQSGSVIGQNISRKPTSLRCWVAAAIGAAWSPAWVPNSTRRITSIVMWLNRPDISTGPGWMRSSPALPASTMKAAYPAMRLCAKAGINSRRWRCQTGPSVTSTDCPKVWLNTSGPRSQRISASACSSISRRSSSGSNTSTMRSRRMRWRTTSP